MPRPDAPRICMNRCDDGKKRGGSRAVEGQELRAADERQFFRPSPLLALSPRRYPEESESCPGGASFSFFCPRMYSSMYSFSPRPQGTCAFGAYVPTNSYPYDTERAFTLPRLGTPGRNE